MTEIVISKKNKEQGILQEVHSGDAFEEFLQSKRATATKQGLSDLGAYNLRASTCDILNHCNPHDAIKNHETTHLVVGYVQSGKTMSFTGVLAMARDNGYRVAIILTGITTNLQSQTSNRLEQDLDLDFDLDRYSFIGNPTDNDTSSVIKALRLSDKPLLIIPILKHRKYIDNVTKIFSHEKVKQVLGKETVLIIDDEADQASLNSYGYRNSKKTSGEDEESPIYASILRMRSKMPGNSYIQYTATPQANILITTMDLLSPKSHTLLIPGEEYIGGKKIFGLEKEGWPYGNNLVVEIPENEVYHKKEKPLRQMPESLRQALMMHIWAVILVIKWYKRPGIKQLTMMVHPTDIIDGNKLFTKWINDEVNFWSESLDKDKWHEDNVMLKEKFSSLLPEALKLYPEEGRPTFEQVNSYLADVINDCKIYRITGKSDDDSNNIRWDSHRMNVLIGAQMLNRGFTVEKLTTTYMPRYSTSITNADTIEQRCRFFGYKKDYIESCRIYLPKDSIRDYTDYVKHEEELRGHLASCSTLKEYEHRVMLSPRLRPTRLNVLPKQMVKTKLTKWTKYERMSGMKMVIENNIVVKSFVKQHIVGAHEFELAHYSSSKYPIGEHKKHSLKEMRVMDIIPMLIDYTAGCYDDIITKSMTIRYLQYLETMGLDIVNVLFMSSDQIRCRKLLDEKEGSWRVEAFQGRSTINENDDYCGDTNLIDSERITLQIHHIALQGLSVANAPDGETYVLAFHFPEKLQIQYNANVTNNYNITE